MENELDKLFSYWKQEMIKNGDGEYFTEDGIIRNNEIPDEQIIKKWYASPKRILFLLKDQNQIGWKGNEDIRDWFKDTTKDKEEDKKRKESNRNIEPTFIKNIAYLFWGLSKVDKKCDWWYDEVSKHIEEVKDFFNSQPFALVECKKQPGEGSLDDSILKKHLDKYGSLLDSEINILKPNIIVCTSQYIYDFVVRTYLQNNELVKLENHDSLRIHPQTKTLIFCSYHPSVFGKSKDFVYEGVMYHYREFLKSKYSF